jgi:hypothetical protein
MKNLFLILFIALFAKASIAQKNLELKEIIEDNDTLLIASALKPVDIISKKRFNSWKEEAEFIKLRRYVAAVYPYAKMAGALHQQINGDLEDLDKKRKKNKYLKVKEDALKEQFEDKLKNLTVNQGKVLIKLINRETGNNCYQLIKDLKSPAAAFFWNIWSKKYDYNLKEPYLAEENQDLEMIVRLIEMQDQDSLSQIKP